MIARGDRPLQNMQVGRANRVFDPHRVRLLVDQDGVTSYGFLTTRRLPWPQIDHFALSEGSSFAHAVLKDDTLVGLPAVQAAQIMWFLGVRSHAADTVAGLEGEGSGHWASARDEQRGIVSDQSAVAALKPRSGLFTPRD